MAEPAIGILLNKLKGQKRKAGGGWMALCPAHDDHAQSLSVDSKDGKVLLTCFTGCSAEAVMAAVGLTLADLFDADPRQPIAAVAPLTFRQRGDRGQLVATYDYLALATGAVAAQKGRFQTADGRKTFLWRPAGADGWPGLSDSGLSLADLHLWGAELLLTDPDATVYFVEGEKAALACRAAGLMAVTHAGGAATKDFGRSLEVLAGRRVALWPDNDGVGREYMALVESRLRGLAAALTTVAVPLPAKGDAYEYFGAGGTIADLRAGSVPLTEPAVDFLADRGIRVTIPSPQGRFLFTFNEIEKTTRALDAELTIAMHLPGESTEPYIERINMLSNSGRDDLRRDLDNVYGKQFGWTRLLNTAFSRARTAFLSQSRRIDLADIEGNDEAAVYLVDRFLPDNAMTIMFGDGSALKSFITQTLVYHMIAGRPFLGMATQGGPVLYLDYEDTAENFRLRMRRIARGMMQQGTLDTPEFPRDLIHYIPGEGIPLRDKLSSLKADIRETGARLLVVDTIGPACGGRPEDAEVALSYTRALAQLNIATLNLAHITKNGERKGDIYYPFGSIFFSNEARRTWYVTRQQEEESDDLDIGVYCRKANDGPKPRPFSIAVHFDGRWGPVTMRAQDISQVPELQEKRPPRALVWEAMAGGRKATIKELTDELQLEQKQVEVAFRNRKLYVVVGTAPATGSKPANLYARAARGPTETTA